MDLAAMENAAADVEEILAAVEALDLEHSKKQVLEDFARLGDCPYCLEELPPFHGRSINLHGAICGNAMLHLPL